MDAPYCRIQPTLASLSELGEERAGLIRRYLAPEEEPDPVKVQLVELLGCKWPTLEQWSAVAGVLEGQNVVVRAVPGAGKTFVLKVCGWFLRLKGGRALNLTYGRDLRRDWQENDPISRGDIHTFHSLAAKMYRGRGESRDRDYDEWLKALVESDAAPAAMGTTALFVDEMQDLSPLYFDLICKHAASAACGPQFVFVGQEQQCVYTYETDAYKRADLTYLRDPASHFGALNARSWVHVRLTRSFRLTRQLAAAVNNFFELDEDSKIASQRECDYIHLPTYRICDLYKTRDVCSEIVKKIEVFGQANVQIVCPQNTEKDAGPGRPSPIRLIINHLTEHDGVTFLGKADRGSGVRVYTCCGCKGTERKCSIVIGADDFASWVTREQQFVSFTRATEHLLVLQHVKSGSWNRATAREIERCGFRVYTAPEAGGAPDRQDCRPKPVSATDLAGAMRCTLKAAARGQFVSVRRAGPDRAYSAVAEVNGGYRPNVACIYGVVAPLLAESRMQGASAARSVPSAYQRIFSPVCVSGRMHDFDRPLLEKYPCMAAKMQHVRANLREYGLRDDKHTHKNSEDHYMRALKQGAREYVDENRTDRHGAETRQGLAAAPELAALSEILIPESEFRKRFPLSRLAELDASVPRDGTPWSPMQAARAAVAVLAFDGIFTKLCQIDNWDWVDVALVDGAADFFRHNTPANSDFEVPMLLELQAPVPYDRPSPMSGISGRMDALHRGSGTIVEYKMKALDDGDKAQLLIYAHMYNVLSAQGPVQCRLLSGTTGEICHATVDATRAGSRAFLARVVEEQLTAGGVSLRESRAPVAFA